MLNFLVGDANENINKKVIVLNLILTFLGLLMLAYSTFVDIFKIRHTIILFTLS
jgi:hypothetical protein